jgi:hypothetical protein
LVPHGTKLPRDRTFVGLTQAVPQWASSAAAKARTQSSTSEMVPSDPSKHFAEVWPERQDIGAPVPILRDPILYSAIHYDIDYYRLS